MDIKKSLIAGVMAASGFFAGAAHAGVVNVGGIIWDTDSPLDFSSTTATIQQNINSTTGELSGFGVITTINGTGVSTFLQPGVATELTFAYYGFTPVGEVAIPNPIDPAGSQILYEGGVVQLYVGGPGGLLADPFNPLALNLANTTDGTLWLSLTGHEIEGVSLIGTNNFSSGFLLGNGLLDVIGGLAQANFDTNTQEDGADFTFTNSFTSFPTNSILFATGAGTYYSDSITTDVPEPTTIALLGLGLLGITATRRSKRSKN
ncbi:MAG TPA: PEP-CTERM sorting domain-containing protein [Nitrosomonas europaea]|uniref:PEP-CTERM sorting domain-containing protein n=1 Tax=Nitrosomonas europaea TaxID=915 RepID=UPI002491F794|nr:PEP-CTERM sorting domain-containing protein [Nitrosomonas europaea]HRN82851.1 PEP-CTERM sorting domain-containing protein [Nitrosomonas europaea]HRO55655.1 PEP-CTERM sorting domain-containing protein [Nitrosomonas europaea]HUM72848.1 PEP-CTERM sorting domain-containing protein [Nitrosomonas europaea]